MTISTIPIGQLFSSLSQVIDLVDARLASHHQWTATIAGKIAEGLGLPEQQRQEIVVSGFVHDVGAFSRRDKINLLDLDVHNKSIHQHAIRGAALVGSFSPFARIARNIKYHHVRWDHKFLPEAVETEDTPLESLILHLSDRVAALLRAEAAPLAQSAGIMEFARKQSGKMFKPELVEAFLEAASREAFWLDVIHRQPLNFPGDGTFEQHGRFGSLNELADLFSCLIDFRSPYTASHSAGVAAGAEQLAQLSGFSPDDCYAMRIAGKLHDLGKLVVPTEILEKHRALTAYELSVIRSHTYYTAYILEPIQGLAKIRNLAARHHEKLDGNGYPFKLAADELSVGERIMTVMDIFAALSEDRPYRKGMDRPKVLAVMRQMVTDGELDGDILALLERNSEAISAVRLEAGIHSREKYNALMQGLR